MERLTEHQRTQIARECLRQLWQNYDAGGHSMGRSRESVWLEAAMAAIPSTNEYSEMADDRPKEFSDLVAEMWHQIKQEKCDEFFAVKREVPERRMLRLQDADHTFLSQK